MVSSLLWVCLFAAPKAPSGTFFRFGDGNDLFIEERITCMLQSERGLMWFGTQRGLVRFDGVDVLHFRSQIEDPHSIPTDNISCLRQTDPDFLWVGTQGGGLFQFDTVTGRRRLWREDKIAGTIWSVVVDRDSRLWVACSDGLWRIPANGVGARKINDFPTRKITLSQSGGIWQATNDRRLLLVNPRDSSSREVAGVSQLLIRDMLEDTETLWLASEQGLFRVDRFEAQRARHWPLTGQAKPLFARARSLARDPHGSLWVGGYAGLWRRRQGTNRFEHFQADPGNPTALRNNRINHIWVDSHHQLLWVANQIGGVDTYPLLQDKFHFQGTRADTSGLLIHKNNLWVAKLSLGINRIDLADLGRQKTFLKDLRVGTMIADDADGIWFATNRGLYHLAAGAHQPQPHPINYQDGKKHRITALLRQGDALWLGTRGGLFRKMLGEDRAAESYSEPEIITCIRNDARGRVWVGTFTKGVTRLDPETGHRTHYRKASTASAGGLSDNTILDLLIDPTGIVWIATLGGLNQLDPDTGKVTYFTLQTGFPDNAVTSLVLDRENRLWCNTGIGIVTHRADGYRVLSHRVEKFNLAAATTQTAACAPDGRLFFGGTRGWVGFDPEVIDEMQPPKVMITRIDRDGERIAIARTPSLYLDQDHESLEIEWTTVDYNNPRYNRLRARIGESGDFRDQRGKWTARFTSDMSWGRREGLFPIYVEGINQRGLRSTTAETVWIEDPLWKKWWWLLLGSFFMMSYAAGHTVVQARNRKRRRILEARAELAEAQFAAAERKRRYEAAARKLQEEHFWMLQQHLDQVSTQIAHDLHDGPLAELSGMGFRLHAMQQAELDDTVKQQLADFTENLVPHISHELRNVCSDLLVPDFDMSLALEVASFTENMAERYPDITFDMTIEEDPDTLSAAAKSTLFRIARTLLQNVAKHAQAAQAEVTLAYRGDRVQLVVEDNGIGFSAPQAWDQLKKEKHYGLYMSHYFANALGGDLVVHGKIGEGTRIEVTLPQDGGQMER